MGDDVGEHAPFTPREARILGGEGTIGPTDLDGGDVVIVDADAASEGGILEDFRLALADLDRSHRAEGCELTREGDEAMDAKGEVNGRMGRSVGSGGDGCVAHAYYSIVGEKNTRGHFFTLTKLCDTPWNIEYRINVYDTPLKAAIPLD